MALQQRRIVMKKTSRSCKVFRREDEEAMLQMCGFTTLELAGTYVHVSKPLEITFGTGRGQRRKTTKIDAFYMTYVTMKHGGTRDFLERRFCMKKQAFERMVINVINSTVETLHEECVALVFSLYPLLRLRECGNLFHPL